MIIVYDGNNTAYRCNCTTELYTKEGERVSAIYGIINSIRRDVPAIEKMSGLDANGVTFAWDYGKSQRRMELFPEYKANRKKEKTADDILWFEEFLEQANFLHNNLKHFGIRSLKVKGWEADDLAYAIAEEIDDDIVFVSTDEDWLQLISDKVSVYSPVKKLWIDVNNFEEVMGVPQHLFLDYKVMKGDTSDGIPGIHGIGEKTGKGLVNDYGTLSTIMQFQETLQKSKRYAPMFTEEGRRLLFRNMRLMDLEYVDYSPIMEELMEVLNAEVVLDREQVVDILKSKQFVSILMELKKWMAVYQKLSDNKYT